MPKSAMPVLCRVLVPEVLPAVMPGFPAVPEVLPVPLPDLVLPSRLPADLPAEGRAALAAALEASCPPGSGRKEGNWHADQFLPAGMMPSWRGCGVSCARWMTSAAGSAASTPLDYLLALPLIAGMAGDGELDAAAEWAATAPPELLLRLGARLDRTGEPRRPDATTLSRGLAGCDQGQYDDGLCAWSAARSRALSSMRRHRHLTSINMISYWAVE